MQKSLQVKHLLEVQIKSFSSTPPRLSVVVKALLRMCLFAVSKVCSRPPVVRTGKTSPLQPGYLQNINQNRVPPTVNGGSAHD